MPSFGMILIVGGDSFKEKGSNNQTFLMVWFLGQIFDLISFYLQYSFGQLAVSMNFLLAPSADHTLLTLNPWPFKIFWALIR